MATPKLKVPRSEAADVLDAHRGEGKQLLGLAVGEDRVLIREQEGYMEWGRERSRWISRTKDALDYIYEGQDAAKEFEEAAESSVFGGAGHWAQDFESDFENVRDAMNILLSLSERLQYADEPEPQPTAHTQPEPVAAPTETGTPVIFLVHGHAKGVREEVARFLTKAGQHDVVILDEKANRGRTLMEKFEAHASEAAYAVILLTGDDVGGPSQKEGPLFKRARQNVVFELGFFFGRIGRNRVAVLYEHDVEKPSDIDGLVYIALDSAGAWKGSIVKELRAADLDFSLDRL